MGKFCHCRFMDIIHIPYNVGQAGTNPNNFLYFLGIDDGSGFPTSALNLLPDKI